MNRRDLLLQQMNISQWQLVKPQVLKGDAQIRLAENIKLVVICEQDRQQSPLFLDILHTLNLQPNEFQWLNLEQSMRLVFSHNPQFWLLQPERQAVRFGKKFANVTPWQHSDWDDLQDPTTKRQFWRQIEPCCAHFE